MGVKAWCFILSKKAGLKAQLQAYHKNMPKKKQQKRLTKPQLINALAESSGVNKKDVAAVLEALFFLIGKQLKTRGPGEVVIPGIVKLRTVRKPAQKRRKGRNPFTGEEIMIPAKKASNTVKATVLKKIKDLV
jgi:nucleoid DNA-binding protein